MCAPVVVLRPAHGRGASVEMLGELACLTSQLTKKGVIFSAHPELNFHDLSWAPLFLGKADPA